MPSTTLSRSRPDLPVFLQELPGFLAGGIGRPGFLRLRAPDLPALGIRPPHVLPPLTGRVMLGDAEWTAAADGPIEAGANVRVIAQQNLTMKVEEI